MINIDGYRINDPDALPTPAMVLFEDRVEHNIRSVCELAGGAQNLFTHVKTHKSAAITRKQVEAGIDSFKCATLKELRMVLQLGANHAVLAYPQTQVQKIESLFGLIAEYPAAWIATIAGSSAHIDKLGDVAGRRNQTLPVLLDLDPGMHRTGINMDDAAVDLYRRIDEHAHLDVAGLHWYDGHDTFSDPGEREEAARRHIKRLLTFRQKLEAAGMAVPYIIGGGAYSFPYYARTGGMHGAPGSFIYWDARCRGDMPDMPFRNAALILAQVVDRHPERGTVTTDLGYKNICSDQPLDERVRLPGFDAAELVMHNEEYGVFRLPGELPEIGAYVLAIPGHIGPTTVRYPGSHVIDAAGEIVDYIEHTARDR